MRVSFGFYIRDAAMKLSERLYSVARLMYRDCNIGIQSSARKEVEQQGMAVSQLMSLFLISFLECLFDAETRACFPGNRMWRLYVQL